MVLCIHESFSPWQQVMVNSNYLCQPFSLRSNQVFRPSNVWCFEQREVHLAGSSLWGLWFGGAGFSEGRRKADGKKTGDLVNIYGLRFSSSSREFPGVLFVCIGFWKALAKFLLGNWWEVYITLVNVNMDPQSSDSMRKHTRHTRLVPWRWLFYAVTPKISGFRGCYPQPSTATKRNNMA